MGTDPVDFKTCSLGLALQWYLILSYAYYKASTSLVLDHTFDLLCKRLADGWDSFEHQHKHLTNLSDLLAGTGYAIKYPTLIEHSALLAIVKQNN